jgi:hypothetical protein
MSFFLRERFVPLTLYRLWLTHSWPFLRPSCVHANLLKFGRLRNIIYWNKKIRVDHIHCHVAYQVAIGASRTFGPKLSPAQRQHESNRWTGFRVPREEGNPTRDKTSWRIVVNSERLSELNSETNELSEFSAWDGTLLLFQQSWPKKYWWVDVWMRHFLHWNKSWKQSKNWNPLCDGQFDMWQRTSNASLIVLWRCQCSGFCGICAPNAFEQNTEKLVWECIVASQFEMENGSLTFSLHFG